MESELRSRIQGLGFDNWRGLLAAYEGIRFAFSANKQSVSGFDNWRGLLAAYEGMRFAFSAEKQSVRVMHLTPFQGQSSHRVFGEFRRPCGKNGGARPHGRTSGNSVGAAKPESIRTCNTPVRLRPEETTTSRGDGRTTCRAARSAVRGTVFACLVCAMESEDLVPPTERAAAYKRRRYVDCFYPISYGSMLCSYNKLSICGVL